MVYKFKCMKPIGLTEYGDTLLEYPRQVDVTSIKSEADKNPDDGTLSSCVGVHDVCRGWMDIRVVSKTHRRITCRTCKLNITVPVGVVTYRQLREFCKGELGA